MKNNLHIAIVGATGLVGRKMIRVLEESTIEPAELSLFASARTAGTKLSFKGNEIEVRELKEDSFSGIDIALFSAGGSTSRKYAPIAASQGCIAIDNSSAWRMDEKTPLVVPEVNSGDLAGHHGIIANPNCSTIQMLVAIKPIYDKYGIKRLVVSTYQSISGAGQKGLDKLEAEISGADCGNKHKIAFNAIFHPYSGTDGQTVEEKKMVDETRKMLHDPDLPVAVTCVRLPFKAGHGESINLELERPFTIEELSSTLKVAHGISVLDDIENDIYPTPIICEDTNDVYIGRIRHDRSVKNGLAMWVVADNIRKGAATNAVQIAEEIIKRDLFEFECLFT